MTFADCFAKLERARVHGAAIQAEIKALGKKENLTALSADLDRRSGYNVFHIKSVPDYKTANKRIGIMLGDFVHNVRSALDYMTYQLALFRQDGTLVNEDAVQFPIADDPHRFTGQAGRYLREVHVEHVAFIETLQPYQPWTSRPYTSVGNPMIHPLALLRDLSNRDKHRLLTPVLQWANFINITEFAQYALVRNYGGGFGVPDILPHSPVTGTDSLVVGEEVMRARLIKAEPHLDLAGYIQPAIVLPPDRQIYLVVEALEDFVRVILQEVETLPLPSRA